RLRTPWSLTVFHPLRLATASTSSFSVMPGPWADYRPPPAGSAKQISPRALRRSGNLPLEEDRGVLDGHLAQKGQLLLVEFGEAAGHQVVVLGVAADLDALDLRLQQGAVEGAAEVGEEAPLGEELVEVEGAGRDALSQGGAGAPRGADPRGEAGAVQL